MIRIFIVIPIHKHNTYTIATKKHEQKHIKITKHAIKWIDEPHTK